MTHIPPKRGIAAWRRAREQVRHPSTRPFPTTNSCRRVMLFSLAIWVIAATAMFGVIVRPWNSPECLWVMAGAAMLVLFHPNRHRWRSQSFRDGSARHHPLVDRIAPRRRERYVAPVSQIGRHRHAARTSAVATCLVRNVPVKQTIAPGSASRKSDWFNRASC
jgi:hypothetical protein